MDKQNSVNVRTIYLNKTTKQTIISSPHVSIIRHLTNASDKKISEVIQIYNEIEKEYVKENNKKYIKK